MFKNILVPTDGSPLSQEALRKAVTFAKEAGARIVAFYAKPEAPMPQYIEGIQVDKMVQEQYDKAAEQQAKTILGFAEGLCRDAGVACSTATASSDSPYEAIIDAANANGCDLIFMASHGRRGISGLLLGSETSKVLTHSKIPVLVFR
jgi:nucleotide-binding universal stress UspA family protein